MHYIITPFKPWVCANLSFSVQTAMLSKTKVFILYQETHIIEIHNWNKKTILSLILWVKAPNIVSRDKSSNNCIILKPYQTVINLFRSSIKLSNLLKRPLLPLQHKNISVHSFCLKTCMFIFLKTDTKYTYIVQVKGKCIKTNFIWKKNVI